MHLMYALVFLIIYPAHGSICTPKLSDGVPSTDSFKQIECEVSTCSSVSQLRFEKIINNKKEWTPVYEKFNETYHQYLDTDLSQYSLRNRSSYKDFQFKHILYINPLTLADHGKWRCVVYDITGSEYASNATDINIHGSTCIPKLSDGIPSMENFKQIECEVSTCNRVSQVRFEKIINNQKEWTPVYERFNETNHQYLDTNLSQYSLKYRSSYKEFQFKHILYINPLTLEDHGKWRCVVYDITGLEYTSNATDISMYGSTCTPKLSDGIPSMDNFKQLECEVSTCISVSQLRFEKMINNQKEWTPVYEKFNETYHQYLDTNLSQYSLRNRSRYKDFQFKPILYINPLTLEDHGKWRCVVYDNTGLEYVSNATDINIYVTPPKNLRIVPNNVELYTNQTTEFMCITDGIHPVPDVLWIVGGTDQYTGTPSNTQHADGLWSVMNTLKLSFNIVGVSDLRCIMRTNDRDRWMQNHIRIIVKDTKQSNRDVTTLPYDINRAPSNIYDNVLNGPLSVLCALGIVIVMLALWKGRKRFKGIIQRLHWSGRPRCNHTAYAMIPTGKRITDSIRDVSFIDRPKSAIFTQTIGVPEGTWTIWRSTQSDCVYVGGKNSPSITVIGECSKLIRRVLPRGTAVVHGMFIKTFFHLINVYDKALNTHSIYCVVIDPQAEQLTLKYTFQLSDEIIEPRCMFAIDRSRIGIYCAQKRKIEVLDTDNISSSLTHVDIITLTGFDANENDSLCVNTKGHICVLSYKYRNVYICNTRGEFIYNFNMGMWYDPVHIQCCSDDTLVVVNLYGEMHRFDDDSKSTIIKLDKNAQYIQAAVFTGLFLWVIDALDSTKIHVFKTGNEHSLATVV